MSAQALQRLDFMVSLIDKVSGPAGKMMKTMDKVTTSIQTGFKKIGFGAAGLVGVGYAVNGLIGKAVEFESVMADVNKTVNFTTDDGLAKLSNTILEMTKTLPITAVGLGEIAAAGGRLGLNSGQLKGFIDVTAKMATAFDLQTGLAGKYAANLSNIYSIPIDKLSLLGDVVNHLSDNTAAEAGDIIDVLQRVGGMGQQFGLATNEIAAMSAQMLSLGIPSEQVATSMNSIFIRMLNLESAGPKVQRVLNGMGMSAKSFAADMANDPQIAINKFLKTVNSLSSREASIALSTIFGLEHAPKITLLAKSFGQYEKTLGLVADKQQFVGSMEKEFQIRSQTTANKIVLMGNAWDRLMVGFGSMLLPTVIQGIGWFSSILDPISTKMARWAGLFPNLSGWVGKITGLLFAAVAVVSALSIAIGVKLLVVAGWQVALIALTPLLAVLKFSLLTMVPAIWGFTAALLANPITWIIAAIALLGYGLYKLGQKFGVFDFIKEKFTALKTFLSNIDVFGVLMAPITFIKNELANLLPQWAIDLLPSAGGGATTISPPSALRSTNVRRGGPNGGLVNRISNASSNNSRSIGEINIYNSGDAMSSGDLLDAFEFEAG